MGIVECLTHKVMEPYPVLYEKEGKVVAQFKFTVLIMPNGPLRITQGVHHPEFYKSEHSIKDPEIKVGTKAAILLLLFGLNRTRVICLWIFFTELGKSIQVIQVGVRLKTNDILVHLSDSTL